MSDFSLTLGPVAFAGFELPSSITIGGQQRLAIHRLPGGVRIIDAMGPDAADIAFSGIFTGPDAADRARALDLLRSSGQPYPLVWDRFYYTVIVSRFEADYRSPWWLPYRISCTVLQDEITALAAPSASLLLSVASDLTEASAYGATDTPQVSAAQMRVGTGTYAAAVAGIAGSSLTLAGRIATATQGLASTDTATAIDAAGTAAQLTIARSYLDRAGRNLANAST